MRSDAGLAPSRSSYRAVQRTTAQDAQHCAVQLQPGLPAPGSLLAMPSLSETLMGENSHCAGSRVWRGGREAVNPYPLLFRPKP